MAEPEEIALTIWEKAKNYLNSLLNSWIKALILSGLVLWLALETILAAPHFLSYYNEIFGGKYNGYLYATDSNFDWGQDLKRLKTWIQKNLETNEKIAVDYFGGGDLEYYLGSCSDDSYGRFRITEVPLGGTEARYSCAVPWWSAKGNPKEENIEWLAISANTIQGALAKPAADFYKNPADEYLWLEKPYEFADRAGTSIFIYKLR